MHYVGLQKIVKLMKNNSVQELGLNESDCTEESCECDCSAVQSVC